MLGSAATGIGDVAQAVRLAADVGDRFTVPVIASRRQFEDELMFGTPGERRVVMTDLVSLAPRDEACMAALNAALELRPQPRGVTRAAVIVAGPHQMCLWRAILGDAGHTPALGTVTLRRYDRQTLRVWALASEKFSVLERLNGCSRSQAGGRCSSSGLRSSSLTGWTRLRRCWRCRRNSRRRLAQRRSSRRVGVTADEDLIKAFNAILGLVDSAGVALTDLHAAAEMAVDDPHTAIACLQALGVFDIDAEGVYRPEPLLVRSWTLRL